MYLSLHDNRQAGSLTWDGDRGNTGTRVQTYHPSPGSLFPLNLFPLIWFKQVHTINFVVLPFYSPVKVELSRTGQRQ